MNRGKDRGTDGAPIVGMSGVRGIKGQDTMRNRNCRLATTKELSRGMLLHRLCITDRDGQVIHCIDTTLDGRILEDLNLRQIGQVEIREEYSFVSTPAVAEEQSVPREIKGPAVEPPAWAPATAEPRKNFSEPVAVFAAGFAAAYAHALKETKDELIRARFLKSDFSLPRMKSIADRFLLPILEYRDVLLQLHSIPHQEDYFYHHSVDVAVITGCLGRWMGFSSDMIPQLVLAGLVHDIGKALVPLKIINKMEGLTREEWEIAQLHAIRGYRYLRHNFDIPPAIQYGVLQHHERMDGSGYPLAVTGDRIDICARVIAVADVFSAMTSPRPYRQRNSVAEAMEALKQEASANKLDPQVCSVFLYHLQESRGVGSLLAGRTVPNLRKPAAAADP